MTKFISLVILAVVLWVLFLPIGAFVCWCWCVPFSLRFITGIYALLLVLGVIAA